MGVISLIMALGLLPFHLYLHHLRANAKLSYQRISKPSSQILLSSIRCPVPSTDIRKHTREKPIAKPHPPDFIHVLSLKGLFLYVAPHPHDRDVFEELDTSRESSWQYKLQQLKFANQRLYE